MNNEDMISEEMYKDFIKLYMNFSWFCCSFIHAEKDFEGKEREKVLNFIKEANKLGKEWVAFFDDTYKKSEKYRKYLHKHNYRNITMMLDVLYHFMHEHRDVFKLDNSFKKRAKKIAHEYRSFRHKYHKEIPIKHKL